MKTDAYDNTHTVVRLSRTLTLNVYRQGRFMLIEGDDAYAPMISFSVKQARRLRKALRRADKPVKPCWIICCDGEEIARFTWYHLALDYLNSQRIELPTRKITMFGPKVTETSAQP